MNRPTAEIYVGCTLLAALLGAVAGSTCQALGGFWLLLFTLAMLVALVYYGFAVWDLPKDHPVGLIFGVSGFALFMANIAAWMAWTSDELPFLLGHRFGLLVGLVGFTISAPGFVLRRFRAGIRAGAPLSVLINTLTDPEADLRCRAALALGEQGLPEATTAVPALLLAADDENAEVRLHADGALLMLGVPTDTGWRRLHSALDEAGGGLSLLQWRRFGPALVPLLLRALKEGSAEARGRAAGVLALLGLEAPDAAPGLSDALADPVANVRQAAAEALGTLGSGAEKAVPALQQAQGDRTRAVRRAATRAIANIHNPSTPALFPLRRLVKWGVAAAFFLLLGYGCLQTTPGKVNRLCLLRDLGGVAAAPAFVAALGDTDSEVQSTARKCLRKLGSASVPALLQGLTSSNPTVRRQVHELLGEQQADVVPALTEALDDEDPRVRRVAAAQLAALGPKAAPAVSALARLATEPVLAAQTLARIGPAARAATPALITILKHPDAAARRQAALALEAIGPAARAALVPLLQALKDRDDRVRQWALAALEKVSPPHGRIVHAFTGPIGNPTFLPNLKRFDAPLVPALIDVLQYGSAPVRRGAVAALGKIGLASPEAVRALTTVLGDKDKALRIEAIRALGRLGSAGVPALMKPLMDGDTTVWGEASEALAAIGGGAVPALQPALTARNPSLRARAAYTLAAIGPAARSTLPELRVCLKDPYKYARLYAAAAAWKVGQKTAAVPVLAALLGDADDFVRRYSARTLAEMGVAAQAAVKPLATVLKDPDVRTRLAAAQALGGIGKAAAPAVPALSAAAKDSDPKVRLAAITALGNIGPEAAEAVPVLMDVVREKNASLLEAAAVALGKIGPEARAAVPVLIQALDFRLAPDAIYRALAGIGPEAAAAIPALVKAALGQGSSIKESLPFAALLRIDPGLRETVRNIRLVLGDRKQGMWTRRAALEAIARLGSAVRAVVPDVLALLKDRQQDDVHEQALAVLGQFGLDAGAAVPVLLERVRDPRAPYRAASARALARIAPRSKEAFTTLTALLRETNDALRRSALEALAGMAAEAGDPVPALAQMLNGEKEGPVIDAALTLIQKIGPRARPTIPALRRLLKDLRSERRFEAALALWRIERRAEDVFPVMLGALGAAWDDSQRERLARRLSTMGTEAVPPLLAALKKGRKEPTFRGIIIALGQIGPPARDAVPELIAALKDGDAVSQRAAEALGRIGPAAKSAVPALLKALKEWGPHSATHPALYAAEALVRIDPPSASAALPLLLTQARTTPGNGEPARAIRILGLLGPRARQAVPVLLKVYEEAGRKVLHLEMDARVERRLNYSIRVRGYRSASYDLPLWKAIRRAASEALRKIDPAAAANAGLDSSRASSATTCPRLCSSRRGPYHGFARLFVSSAVPAGELCRYLLVLT